jgi:hypothetical protein
VPVTYTIDTKGKIIRTRCMGMLTLAEVVEHFRELERDPECTDRLDVLLDVSEVNSLPNASQIRAAALEVKKIQKKVRFEACAIVAVTDALFGMLRMFEVMAQDYFRVIRVFRAATEAEAWLVSQRQRSGQARS